jgi:hypothetical protein
MGCERDFDEETPKSECPASAGKLGKEVKDDVKTNTNPPWPP